MNILCIYSVDDYGSIDRPLLSPTHIPYGMALIAAVLKQKGHRVRILVLTPDTNIERLLYRTIQEEQPELFCLTAVSTQYPFICRTAEVIKRLSPSSFIILGGHHATLNPEHALTCEPVDCICIGEGEEAIVELAVKLEEKAPITGIKNLWIKNRNHNTIEKNGQNPFISELDALPFIDRDLWKPWIHGDETLSGILIGRGCPNKCNYCSNHRLATIADGKYVRFRSPGNIIAEIEEILRADNRIDFIYLEVETLGAHINYAFGLLDGLKAFNASRERKVRFGCNIAVTSRVIGNEALLKKMKEANFEFVILGLESGSERVRKEILNRPSYMNKDIVDFCELARKYGINTRLYVMVGLPGETLSDFRETIECTRICRPEFVYLSIFFPYPGTKLYDMVKEGHLLKEASTMDTLERRQATLDLPGFSRKDIQRQYLLFYFNTFRGLWPLRKIFLHVARAYLGTNHHLERLYRRITSLRTIGVMKHRVLTHQE